MTGKECLYRGLEIGGMAAIAWWLLRAGFSKEIRDEILERDNYTCVVTGRSKDRGWYIHASHDNHDKTNRNYNTADMGEARCVAAHLALHMAYEDYPEEIGLSQNHNEFAKRELRKTDAKLWGFDGPPLEADGTPNYDYNAHQRFDWDPTMLPQRPATKASANGSGEKYSLEELNEMLFGD